MHVFVFHFAAATEPGLHFPPPFHFFFAPRQTFLRIPTPLNFGMECLDRNSRPRAVVILSSEPRAASEKVKLCKLMVKRRRDWGEERGND